jgi:peptidylprolyl isomerase
MRTKILTTVLALMLSQNIINAKVIAVVNGENLTDEDVKPMLVMFGDAKTINDLNENEKKMIIDQTLEKKLILQQAKKEKVQENPKFQKIVASFQERLIVEFWMKEHLDKIKTTDKELEEFLTKNREHYPKDAKLETLKDEITKKVKMQKFQVLIDEKLSNMKKEAKIEYK